MIILDYWFFQPEIDAARASVKVKKKPHLATALTNAKEPK